MLFDINIKSFIRLDQTMLDLLLPTVKIGMVAENHWVYWLVPNKNLTPELKEWLSAQPDDCHAKVSLTSRFTQLCKDEKGRYTAIGISLSQATPSQIRSILDKRKPVGLITSSFIQHNLEDGTLTPTVNEHIFLNKKGDYLYVKTDIGKPTLPVDLSVEPPASTSSLPYPSSRPDPEMAEKFESLLEGHDFFYEYSDSLSVYKAGKRHEEELKSAGLALGLSRKHVDEIYNAKYQSLMKR